MEDKLVRSGTQGDPTVRYATGSLDQSPFVAGRNVNGTTVYLTRGGAAAFDQHSAHPDCVPAYWPIDPQNDLSGRLCGFFRLS